MKQIIIILLLFSPFYVFGQDEIFIKVHFLYGSKPLKKYKNTEKKWFGGVLGGHVGIESEDEQILNFLPKGDFHWFARKKNRHSTYVLHSIDDFYAILGGEPDKVKKAIVYIPVTMQQKQQFDSLSYQYLQKTPYDYALFGMRCGSGTYEILGKLGVLPNFSYWKTRRKIFYPKKLRKRLFKVATKNNWKIMRKKGSDRRKWEKDN